MVPANVALEWVLEPVVAHMDGVHNGVHEGKVAVLAHVGTSQLRGGGAAKKGTIFLSLQDKQWRKITRLSN